MTYIIFPIADSDIATAVSWSSEGQLFSCSDDKDIKRWLADGTCQGKVATLNAYPSSLSWYPSAGKQVTHIITIYCILSLPRPNHLNLTTVALLGR